MWMVYKTGIPATIQCHCPGPPRSHSPFYYCVSSHFLLQSPPLFLFLSLIPLLFFFLFHETLFLLQLSLTFLVPVPFYRVCFSSSVAVAAVVVVDFLSLISLFLNCFLSFILFFSHIIFPVSNFLSTIIPLNLTVDSSMYVIVAWLVKGSITVSKMT